MKLMRYGSPGKEKPGVILVDDRWADVAGFGEDYTEAFFQTNGLKRIEKWIESNKNLLSTVSKDTRLAPPLVRPSKIICIGLNYAKHAVEGGMEIPKEPVIFFKSTSAICGPNDPIIIPPGSKKTDWEVELGVVIGKKASYIREDNAMEYVAGYVLHNDYSERAYQLERGGQWVKGKSNDTFAPLGPYIVTKDEIEDPHNLRLWLKVNGETLQNSNTSDMVFGIPHLISYLSQFMTLLPGDIISTGTPEGVGLGLKPPRYLKAGDVVQLGIDGLGTSSQKAIMYK